MYYSKCLIIVLLIVLEDYFKRRDNLTVCGNYTALISGVVGDFFLLVDGETLWMRS